MGPSGSGKSTLLHLLAGLDRPTADGRWPASGRPAVRPGLGVVFQGPSLVPALDVVENVALPLLLAGVDEPEAVERAAAALDRLELGGLAGALPEELSGGQAQRVAVARVLAGRPGPVLADEPTGQLDRDERDQVVDVLLAAADELGAALVVSTHDEAVAARLDTPLGDGRRAAATRGRAMTARDDAHRAALGGRPRCAGAAAGCAATACGVAVAVALLARLGAFLVSSRGDHDRPGRPGRRRRLAGPGPAGRRPGRGAGPASAAPGHRARAAGRLRTGRRASPPAPGAPPRRPARRRPGPARRLPRHLPARAPHPRRCRRGVLLAQQTAANLGVAPGDTVTITLLRQVHGDGAGRRRRRPARRQLAVPDGRRAAGRPAAPRRRTTSSCSPRAAGRTCSPRWPRRAAPDCVTTQVHVARAHRAGRRPRRGLRPGDRQRPQPRGAARRAPPWSGDNLGAALDAARSDAAYAQVLFLFLGLPGAVLAALLTVAVAGAGASRRRREQALAARAWRAAPRRSSGWPPSRPCWSALGGAVAGLAVAAAGRAAARSAAAALGVAAPAAALAWVDGAALAGLRRRRARVSSLPAWRTCAGPRSARPGAPSTGPRSRAAHRGGPGSAWTSRCWSRGALLVSGQPAGTATRWSSPPRACRPISVSYWAFAGPALLWVGAGLLAWRLTDLVLRRGRAAARPAAAPGGRRAVLDRGRDAWPAAPPAGPRRRPARRWRWPSPRRPPTFNATYRAQAEADAQLTNGADVDGHRAARRPRSDPARRRRSPGCRGCARWSRCSTGSPTSARTCRTSTASDRARSPAPRPLQDAYFSGGTARALMDRLAAAPDSILVSAETVQDYQLAAGRHRQPAAAGPRRPGRPVTVPFRYAGIVKRVPDRTPGQLLRGQRRLCRRPHRSDAVGAFLVDTGGQDTTARRRRTCGPARHLGDGHRRRRTPAPASGPA